MKIGFLGLGEAGYSLAAGLREEGVSGMCAYDALCGAQPVPEALLARARGAGVELLSAPDAVAARAELLFLAVPANSALDSVNQAAAALRAGCLLVDVTTASPAEKARIAACAAACGAKYTDAAMLGPLPKYRHKVPMLVSGDGAKALIEATEPLGMSLGYVNELPGAATSIKYVRSIVTKGFACVLVEALQAAKHFGVEELVVDSVLESMDCPFIEIIDRYVSGTVVHAARRVHEMENVKEMLEGAGLPTTVTDAVIKKLSWLDGENPKARFPDGVPEGWREVVQGWGL